MLDKGRIVGSAGPEGCDVVEVRLERAPAELPLAPMNPLPYRQRRRAAKSFHTGMETLRDAGGPAT